MYLSDPYRVVYLHNLITGQHSCTLSRTISDYILHTNRVLTYGELDTNSEERSTQVVVGNFSIAGTDVYRVWIKLSQNLRHSLLHQLVHVHSVNILVVDNVEQVVQTVAP